MQPHFDSWDLTPVPVPARSRLYSLQPIGVGTPLVESLSGYLIRLATAHAVRVCDLINHELLRSIPYFHAAAGILSAINGIGESAKHWVSALERFTLRDDLRFLTLLPFASLLRTPRLMRRERAWCPYCYESTMEQGQDVYEQLVWCLQCVEVCPLHNRLLETSCRACHGKLRPVCGVSRPGFCSRCRRWLGSRRAPAQEMPTTDYQVWVAREMGQLVGMAPHAQPVGKENIQKILRRYVDSFSEGNMRAASEIAGCRRSSFNNWCNGATSARIDLLLRTCYELRIPLTSLVTGTTEESEDTAGVNAAIEMRRRRCVRPCRTADQIRAALLLAAKEQPPPSIRGVAQRLGSRPWKRPSTKCRRWLSRWRITGRTSCTRGRAVHAAACGDRSVGRPAGWHAAECQCAASLEGRRAFHPPVEKGDAQRTEGRHRPAGPDLLLAQRATNGGRTGPRERLRGSFRWRRFHHSARTGPHARSFAQSPLALGQVALVPAGALVSARSARQIPPSPHRSGSLCRQITFQPQESTILVPSHVMAVTTSLH